MIFLLLFISLDTSGEFVKGVALNSIARTVVKSADKILPEISWMGVSTRILDM